MYIYLKIINFGILNPEPKKEGEGAPSFVREP